MDQAVDVHAEKKPPHPLVTDAETKLFRYVTHADIRRWEAIEYKYRNLIVALRIAIENGEL